MANNSPTKIKATQYMRNVGKSFGYAFAESFRSANPTVTAMFNQSKEYTTNLYHGIKDFKTNFKDFTSTGIGKDVKDVAQEGFSNILSDLKSGKWYNKERSEKSAMSAMGMDDFNFDDDFGDFDFDFDENKMEEISHEDKVTEASTKATINAMDAVGQKTSAAIGAASVHSANYIVKANRANTNALFKLNSEGFSTVASGIAAVNSNIGILVEMGKPLTEHMQNSSLFYAKSTEYQEKSLKLLEQIAANTAPASSINSNRGSSNKRITLMDLVNPDGTLNMGTVKKLGKNALDSSSLGLIVGMAGMFGGVKNTGKMLVSNPIGLVMEMMMGGLLNTKGKRNTKRSSADAMGDFNDVLANFLPGLLAKGKATNFSKTNLPPMLRDLLSTLQRQLPSAGVSRKMNVGNYEKGRVDWDGMSRKALMDVIPTQLGKILAALTGEEEQRFDYKTGKWVKVTDIRGIYKKKLSESANRATGSLFADARKSVQKSKMSNINKRDYDAQVQDFINEIFSNDNEDFFRFINPNEDFDYKKYRGFISEATLKDFRKRVTRLSKSNPKYTKSYAKDMYNERTRYGSEMRAGTGDISESVHNHSLKFGKNTTGSTILSTTDEYGKNIFYYLQGIWSNTEYITDNFSHLIPGAVPTGGKGTEGGANSKNIQLKGKKTPQKSQDSQPNTAPTSYIRDIAALSDNQMNRELASVNEDLEDDKYKGYDKEMKSYMRQKDAAIARGSKPKIDERMERLIADRKATLEKAANAKKFVSGNLGKLKNNKHIANLADLTGTTTDAIIDLLDGASEKINDFIYGTGTNGKSLGDIMKSSVSGIFGSFTKTISDLIPNFIKDWGRSISDALGLREKWDDFKRGTGQALKNFFFGSKEDNWSGPEFARMAEEDVNSGSGSGIGAFYRRASNAVYNAKARNLRGWNNRSYNFSNGVIAYNPGFSAGASRSRRRRVRRTIGRGAGRSGADSDAAAPADDIQYGYEQYLSHPRGINAGIIGTVSNYIIDKLDGNKSEEEERKEIGKTVNQLMKDAGAGKYAMGAGALIGGGLGLLTSAAIGPIAGAAIGAGIGFISKSETAQKFLFGDYEDELDDKGKLTGKKTNVRSGGFIPKKLSNFLEKQAPDMFKAGAIGTVAGSLFGSPVVGGVVGSAVGYIKSSESAKKFLFGGPDKNGEWKEGLINKKTVDYFKKKLPFMGAATIANLLVGPFGPIGSLIAGTAAGFVSDTEKFKGWIFGKKDKNGNRNGGLAKFIKDNLTNPIVDLFKNVTSNMTSVVKETFHNMGVGIREYIIKKLGGRIKKSKLAQKVIGGVKRLGRGIANAATAPIRGLSKAARNHNIRKGRVAYLNGQVMDVNARNIYRHQNAIGFDNSVMSSFDRDILANMVNADEVGMNADQLRESRQSRLNQLTELQDQLENLYDPTKSYDQDIITQREQVQSVFADMLKGKSIEQQNAIGKVYNKFFSKGYLDPEDIKKLTGATSRKDKDESKTDDDFIKKLTGRGEKDAAQEYNLRGKIDYLHQYGVNNDDIEKLIDLAFQMDATSRSREAAKQDSKFGRDQIFENLDSSSTLRKILNKNNIKNISDTELSRMKDLVEIEQDKLKKQMVDAEKDRNKSEESAEKTSENTKKMLEVANKQSETFNKMDNKLSNIDRSLNKIINIMDNKFMTEDQVASPEEIYDIMSNSDFDGEGAAFGSGLRKFRHKLGIGGAGFGSVLKTIGNGALTAGKFIGGGLLAGAKNIGRKIGSSIKTKLKGLGKRIKRKIAGTAGLIASKMGFGGNTPGEDIWTTNQQGQRVLNMGSSAAKEMIQQQELDNEAKESQIDSLTILGNIQLLLEKIAGNVPGGGSGSGGGQDSGGLLGTLGNLLTGGGLSKAFKSSGLGLGSLAVPALMVAGYTGALNEPYRQLGGSEKFSSKMIGSTARGIALGAVKKATGVKAISTGAVAATASHSKLIQFIKKILDTIFNAIKKSKLGNLFPHPIEKFKNAIIDAIERKAKDASREAIEQGLKSAAKVAGMVIAVAAIIWDFEEGYNNASATWKVANPTTGQKIGAGIIHAIMNFIPFIGLFVPESLLIDIYASLILPLIDKEAADNLSDQRKSAEQELADYNAQNGTDLTWAEYTKQVKGNYTWGEKVKNFFKGKKSKGTAAAAGSGLLQPYSMFGIGGGSSATNTSTMIQDSSSSENEPGIYSLIKDIRDSLNNISTLNTVSLAASGGTDLLDNSYFKDKSGNNIISIAKRSSSKALGLLANENEDEAPKSLFGRIVRGVKGWFNKDKNTDETSAGASGMVSQRDPRYAGMSMGGRSVGDMGCGPASAINALNALGKKSSMSSAVSLASRYQTTGGTDLAYFRDEFSRNGVNSSYVSGGSMIDAVASGTPTVLMGRDPFNTSKSRSPFGPNNHYVVANGIDRNGNINISDPELRTTRSYDPSILASVNAGVAATGSGMRMRFRGRRRSYYGVGAGDSGDTKFAIWRYLHENGFNDYAAAGLMGCWECESGNNPRRIEADFIGKFPGYDKVMVSNESLDNYTVNILFPAYGSMKINKSAYVGTDGHYYPGIGLAQWTGPRGYNIIQYAKEKGTGWDDLQTQLEFAIFGNGEFKSRSGGKLIEEMNQSGSIEKATELAFTKYEGCRMSNTTGYNKRLNAAKIFYNMYSGQTYSGGVFDGIQSSNSTFKTSSTSKSNNIFDVIREAFSNIFNRFSNKSSSSVSNNNAIYSGSDAIGDKVNNFPYYNQLENPWAPVQYSSRNDPSQTIKSSGCGPTSMSMVLRSFGQNVTPASIAQLSASRGHRTANSGTAWSMFKDIADLAQVNATQFSSTEDAKNYLRKGYPVIASFGPGDFTKGGHYVVLSGIQGDNFYVNDPASRSRSSKLWPVNKLSQSRQFWAFSKDGKGTLYAGDSANADHYGAGRSGLLYRASGAGNRILLDNSGRFSAGASIINSDLGISSSGTLFTGEKQNQYKSQSRNAYSGMSKETAILLKTIIALATSLVENTSKISSIYDLVKEICEKSGNSQLGAIAQKMSDNLATKATNQNTLSSLNDLRDMVDSILA